MNNMNIGHKGPQAAGEKAEMLGDLFKPGWRPASRANEPHQLMGARSDYMDLWFVTEVDGVELVFGHEFHSYDGWGATDFSGPAFFARTFVASGQTLCHASSWYGWFWYPVAVQPKTLRAKDVQVDIGRFFSVKSELDGGPVIALAVRQCCEHSELVAVVLDVLDKHDCAEEIASVTYDTNVDSGVSR